MSLTLDLNCDMGESFGAWHMGHDTEIMPYISSANIACGYHAGDPAVMRETWRVRANMAWPLAHTQACLTCRVLGVAPWRLPNKKPMTW